MNMTYIFLGNFLLIYYIVLSLATKIINNKKLHSINNHHLTKLFSKNQYWLIMVLLALVLLLLAWCFEWWYGVFGTPSVLSVCLATMFLAHHIFAVSMPKIAPKFRLNRQVQLWFGAVAIVVILMALGFFNVLGIDFYNRYFDGTSFFVQYAIVMMVFLVAFMLDKKSIWLAWAVLLTFATGIMNSAFIFDHIADFWLFIFGIGAWGRQIFKICRDNAIKFGT